MSYVALKRSQIKVRAGFNPRTDHDQKQLNALAGSLIEVGMLQPVIVTENADGYYLLAGHRRIAAADIAGITDIPAKVIQADPDDLTATTVENVARLDLNPIEEAGAYARLRESGKSVDGIAIVCAVPKKRVTERLALLSLPEYCKVQIASEKLGVGSAKALLAMHKVSPLLAEAAARLCVRNAWPNALASMPGSVASEVAAKVGYPFLGAYGSVDFGPDSAPWKELSEDTQELISSAIAELDWDDFAIDVGDFTDALASLGLCYQATEDDRAIYVLDVGAVEHIVVRIAESVVAREPEPDESIVAEDSAEQPEGLSEEEKAQRKAANEAAEKAREERAAEKEARRVARGQNMTLGEKLLSNLGVAELDAHVARFLAEQILHTVNLGQVITAGLRYCLPQFQTEDASGVKYLSTKQALEQRFWEWFNAAKTPEEIIGRLLVTFAAVKYADQDTVAPSLRGHYTVNAGNTSELLTKIAGRNVPKAIRDRVAAADEQAKIERDARDAFYDAKWTGRVEDYLPDGKYHGMSPADVQIAAGKKSENQKEETSS